jgi:hypothetical protein
MSLPKLRELDKYGVITDVDPFDLPLGAWSMGINVRFEDGRVTSAPVWRDVGSPLANDFPRFCYASPTGQTTAPPYSSATRLGPWLHGRLSLRAT